MTSHTIFHEDSLRSALGTHYDVQIEALNRALHYFETMKFTGHKKKFLLGGIISIKGTIALFLILRDKYGVLYFMVQFVNQCHLERFFGILRDMGGADRHPSALHILFRIQRFVTTTLLADNDFQLLAKKNMIIEAKKDIMPEESDLSDLKDLNDLDDKSTPEFAEVFQAIDACNERDGLRYIAGVVAQKTSYLGLNLGSKSAEIAEESPLRFKEMVKSGH